ncbi:tetratricopeptide repeat protein [candidate division FCPU426 bacterium]|nr:tetratricopeptide repeat protein [candidate division FCPU426 bacterium]
MAKDDSGFAEIEEYSKKLNSNPESLVFVPLAEAYRKSGMLDEAIETCLKGLQLHPSYMSARMVLGRAYMEKKMYEEAETEFRKVASADVNNIMAHSLLGQNYMKQNKFADAIKEYQKVLTLNPDDMTAQQMLNKALELARQTNAPRVPAETDKTAADNDRKKTISRAEAFSQQGDIENAIKLYQMILDADPENLVVRQRLKDLEVRKAKASAPRKAPERAKSDMFSANYRDNDKITSDDILSVMKDTVPRIPSAPKTAPAPEPKPAPKAEAKPSVKAPEAAKVADAELVNLPALTKLKQTEGILGIMLMDIHGKVLSSTLKAKAATAELTNTVSLIFSKTEKSVQVMDYGTQVNQILITGEKGQIIFSKIGSKILVVMADENINLGKMRLAMSEVVKALR